MDIPVLEKPRGRGRPPKKPPLGPRVPDPASYDFRTWILGLPPEQVHGEVLGRLRPRQDSVQSACLYQVQRLGMRSGKQPGEVLEVSITVLARLTITPPRLYNLSDPKSWLSSRPSALPYAGGRRPHRHRLLAGSPAGVDPFDPENIFRGLYVAAAWDPLPDEAELLKQYEDLRNSLHQVKDRLDRLITTEASLHIGGTTYRLNPRIWKILDGPADPSNVALAILAYHGKTYLYLIKRRLRKARQERDLRDAWSSYFDWLACYEAAAGELRACFEPFAVSLPKSART